MTRTSGFTLLEMIGVMVVISILLAAAIPLTIDVVQTRRITEERAALPVLAEALKRGMLREQVFPIYQNSIPQNAEDLEEAYWWNLAARNGAVSANEARYPVGSKNTPGNVRKLYFADGTLSDLSFSDLTGNGNGWLNNFQDPLELRMLLVSTTNPDLPLPNTISGVEFAAFWDDWSIGNDGNPAQGNWADYGLNALAWTQRAAELVIERVDLRDWVCEVTLEKRRAVINTGIPTMPFAALNVENTSDLRRVKLVNVSNAEVYVARSSEVTGSPPETNYTIESIVIDGTPIAELFDANLNGLFQEKDPQIQLLNSSDEIIESFSLSLADRNLTLEPNQVGIQNQVNAQSAIQTRYFLLNEIISLFDNNGIRVGATVLSQPFTTIRFDGQRWSY